MNRNPILEELYAAREKLLADAGGDMHKYVQQARERALASGRPLAIPKETTTQDAAAANSTVLATEIQPPVPPAQLGR
jgi:hypothetical protein